MADRRLHAVPDLPDPDVVHMGLPFLHRIPRDEDTGIFTIIQPVYPNELRLVMESLRRMREAERFDIEELPSLDPWLPTVYVVYGDRVTPNYAHTNADRFIRAGHIVTQLGRSPSYGWPLALWFVRADMDVIVTYDPDLAVRLLQVLQPPPPPAKPERRLKLV